MADQEDLEAEAAEHGDPEFAETPVGEQETESSTEAAEDVIENKDPDAEGDKPKSQEELAAELEAANKAVKALSRRVGTLSGEKRELSKKLQSTIKPVIPDDVQEDGEQPVRSDYKTKSEFDAAVAAEAERVANFRLAQQSFTAKCNDVEDKGSKAFGDKWPAAKANLAVLDDEGRIPLDLLNTALETDNPAQVLFVLGNDIDKAAELMAMTPTKRAIAMDRMAQAKPAERQRSNAPAPVDPIGGRGGGNEAPSDKDSDAEWHRKEGLREAAQRRKRLGLA